MCSLHTNIERYTFDDCRFSFDATSDFTHNEYSGREADSQDFQVIAHCQVCAPYKLWNISSNNRRAITALFSRYHKPVVVIDCPAPSSESMSLT